MIEAKEQPPRTLKLGVRDKTTKADIWKMEQVLDPYLADEGAANAVIDLRRMTGGTLRAFDEGMPKGSFRSFSGSKAAEARSFVSVTATT